MRFLKIAQVNINNKVGAFNQNTAKMKAAIIELMPESPHLISFSECVLTGYSAEDWVLWSAFTDKQIDAARDFLRFCHTTCHETYVLFGMNVVFESQVYNCVCVAYGGSLQFIAAKCALPNYSVFYDSRTISAWLAKRLEYSSVLGGAHFGDAVMDAGDFKFGVSICEDIWQGDVIARHTRAGSEVEFNLSHSPGREGVAETRSRMILQRSADNLCAVVYTNSVGGNDSLVSDGGGYVAMCGKTIHTMKRFKSNQVTVCEIDLDVIHTSRRTDTTWRTTTHDSNEQMQVISVPKIKLNNKPTIKKKVSFNFETPLKPWEEKIETILLGLEDYFTKVGAFKSVCISLSGGWDSVLTAILAVMWARRTGRNVAETVKCYSQPTRFNSEATKSVARDLCSALGCSFVEESIEEAFKREVESLCRLTGMSEEELPALTKQNCQARLRAIRMWGISNSTGAMWLQTGNQSERATSYTTVGADLMGSFSLIGNLKKTQINEMLSELEDCRGGEYFLGLKTTFVIQKCLDSVISAELEEGQEDEKDLMPYEVLDELIDLFVGNKMSAKECWIALINDVQYTHYGANQLQIWTKDFIRRFHMGIFKWVQMPECVHLQDIDLDRERCLQLPVVASLEFFDLDEEWV